MAEITAIAKALRAELTGSSTCTAAGIVAIGQSPVLLLCHMLIEAGHDPHRPLEAWRGGALALRIHSIGAGASLTITDNRLGRRQLRNRLAAKSDATASPMPKTERAPR